MADSGEEKHIANAPRVSVVTPVYNGEAYLSQCIESVLAQGFRNFEYLIVNNCSQDKSLDIARRYADMDARIRIHDNAEFLNAEENHNFALSLIAPESRYCKIIAADDALYPECLERMVALAESHPNVGMVGAYGINDKGEVLWQGLPPQTSVVPGKEMCKARLLGGPYIFGTPSSSLIRADLVRARLPEFYNPSNLHADTELCYHLLQESDFGFVHQVLIYRRSNNESQSSYSKRLNTYVPSQISDIIKFGGKFLSPEEYSANLEKHLWNYYAFLAMNLGKRKDKEFWDFHAKSMREMGHPLKRMRLLGMWLKRKLGRC